MIGKLFFNDCFFYDKDWLKYSEVFVILKDCFGLVVKME